MEIINTSHAAIISQDGEKIYGEKNKRFNNDFTFFGGKLNSGETYKEGLLRELFEETGIDFSHKILHILEKEESVNIGDTNFIGNLYLIYISHIEATLLLSHNNRNVEFDRDELNQIPYGFPELKYKLLKALQYKDKHD